MTERVGSWSRPAGWAGPMHGDADPTGGRHAYDQDAALTPIFTTLRRDGCPRPRPAARPLRAVPDLVDDSWLDPPTALLPVVSPVRIDPYAPASFAPPADATGWWDADGTGEYAVVEPSPAWAYDGYDSGYDAAARPVRYGAEARGAGHGGTWGPAHDVTYDVAHDARYDTTYDTPYDTGFDTGYDTGYEAGYDTGYDTAGYGRYDDHRGSYDPVTASGRHHHRLARAGW